MKTIQVYRTRAASILLSKSMLWIPLMLAFLVSGFSPCFGQGYVDTITVQRKDGMYRFSKKGEEFNIKQLSNSLKSDTEAYQKIQAAKASRNFARLCFLAGGVMAGIQLDKVIDGEEPNMTLTAIGTGLITLSLIKVNGFNKQVKQAVDTFNIGQLPEKKKNKKSMDLELSIRGNGAGFMLRF